MTQVQQKYHDCMPDIKPGMIWIEQGNSLIDRGIRWGETMKGDKAKYTHTGVIFMADSDLFIIDSTEPGVKPAFLQDRAYDCADFVCLDLLNVTPQEIAAALETGMDNAISGIKYNYERLLRILIENKLGLNISALDENGDMICSQWDQFFMSLFGKLLFSDFLKVPLITPQNFYEIGKVSKQVNLLFDTFPGIQ
jgi:hypothetical protein